MLKKLFKYEFRAYNKLMLLCLVISAISVTVARVLFELLPLIPENAPEILVSLTTSTVFLSFYASAFVLGALVMVPSIILAVNFYKKLVKDEGYLSFTLPVKNSDHLFCKTSVSVIWSILASVFAVLIVFAAVFIGIDNDIAEAIRILVTEAWKSLGGIKLSIVVAEAAVFFLISLILQAISIAFSISIGQLCKKYKLIGSIGAYIGVNFALRFISTVVFYVTIFSSINISFEEGLFTASQVLIIPPMVLYLVVSIVLYAIAKRVITYKLNLE